VSPRNLGGDGNVCVAGRTEGLVQGTWQLRASGRGSSAQVALVTDVRIQERQPS